MHSSLKKFMTNHVFSYQKLADSGDAPWLLVATRHCLSLLPLMTHLQRTHDLYFCEQQVFSRVRLGAPLLGQI